MLRSQIQNFPGISPVHQVISILVCCSRNKRYILMYLSLFLYQNSSSHSNNSSSYCESVRQTVRKIKNESEMCLIEFLNWLEDMTTCKNWWSHITTWNQNRWIQNRPITPYWCPTAIRSWHDGIHFLKVWPRFRIYTEFRAEYNEIVCKEAGIYRLLFSNKHGRVWSKSIQYYIDVKQSSA